MGYATVFHVEAYTPLRAPITASSKPSATQVALYCEHSAAILDGVIRDKGYALPIATTATSTLKWLEMVNAVGAWAAVERSAPSSNQVQAAEKLWQSYLTMLKLQDVQLDAPHDPTDEQIHSIFSPAQPSPMFSLDLQL